MSLFKKLTELAQEHAKLDPAIPTDVASSEQEPLYLEDLEARARRENLEPRQIYERDQKLLSQDNFPTAQCLKPGEVWDAAFNPLKLSPPRSSHLRTCLYCKTVVAHSKVEDSRAAAIALALARASTDRSANAPEVIRGGILGLPWATSLLGYACLVMLAVVPSGALVTWERQERNKALAATRASYEELFNQARSENQQLRNTLNTTHSAVTTEIDRIVKAEFSDLINHDQGLEETIRRAVDNLARRRFDDLAKPAARAAARFVVLEEGADLVKKELAKFLNEIPDKIIKREIAVLIDEKVEPTLQARVKEELNEIVSMTRTRLNELNQKTNERIDEIVNSTVAAKVNATYPNAVRDQINAGFLDAVQNEVRVRVKDQVHQQFPGLIQTEIENRASTQIKAVLDGSQRKEFDSIVDKTVKQMIVRMSGDIQAHRLDVGLRVPVYDAFQVLLVENLERAKKGDGPDRISTERLRGALRGILGAY